VLFRIEPGFSCLFPSTETAFFLSPLGFAPERTLATAYRPREVSWKWSVWQQAQPRAWDGPSTLSRVSTYEALASAADGSPHYGDPTPGADPHSTENANNRALGTSKQGSLKNSLAVYECLGRSRRNRGLRRDRLGLAKPPSERSTLDDSSPPAMSADFWAGYVSGAVGILIGNPLDLIKVRLQAARVPSAPGPGSGSGSAPVPATAAAPPPAAAVQTASGLARQFGSATSLVRGAAAPVLGYGALNALLFVSYNRAEAALNGATVASPAAAGGSASLWSTWFAGAVGGLATWVVSTPTELVKCRAQLASGPPPAASGAVAGAGSSSWAIAKHVWRAEGVRGFYFGGVVTALRDSIGYGFYFWSYELSTRWWVAGRGARAAPGDAPATEDAARVLLCGGLAGIVTWASIFPLDVIKTRVQTQAFGHAAHQTPLLAPLGLAPAGKPKQVGAVEIAKEAFREGGARVFFRGLTVCSIRAFIGMQPYGGHSGEQRRVVIPDSHPSLPAPFQIRKEADCWCQVNAAQWAVYEWIMRELGHGRARKQEVYGD